MSYLGAQRGLRNTRGWCHSFFRVHYQSCKLPAIDSENAREVAYIVPDEFTEIFHRRSALRSLHRTCVADASVVDLDTDFMRLRRCNFDLLDREVLAGLPGNGGLAFDGLQRIDCQSFSLEAVTG